MCPSVPAPRPGSTRKARSVVKQKAWQASSCRQPNGAGSPGNRLSGALVGGRRRWVVFVLSGCESVLRGSDARFLRTTSVLLLQLIHKHLNTTARLSFRLHLQPPRHSTHSPPSNTTHPSRWRLRYVPCYLPRPPPASHGRCPSVPSPSTQANVMPQTAREVRDSRCMPRPAPLIDVATARLSSPGFASRLSATMVSAARHPPAVIAHANGLVYRDGYVHEGQSTCQLRASGLTY